MGNEQVRGEMAPTASPAAGLPLAPERQGAKLVALGVELTAPEHEPPDLLRE